MAKITYLNFIFAFLFLSSYVNGQIVSVKVDKAVLNQFEKTEWTIALNGKWANPYDQKEIALDLKFTRPSGKVGLLPCFYVSGKSGELSTWNARFAPLEVGKYTFQFVLKQKLGTFFSETSSLIARKSACKGFLRSFNNWAFRFDNGEAFRAIGENIGWESRDNDDSKYFKTLHEEKRFNYDYMIPKLAANGGNFFRTWMIYWNLPVDWKSVQNNSRYTNTNEPYNESGMKRLDHLLHICDSVHMYMMLALESHASLMGDGWKLNNYNVANGGFAKTPYEFFASAEARQQYKNKLRLMVARFGYSTNIAAWEFFNEVDNAMYQGAENEYIPHSVVVDWHREMANYLKQIDPYHHLITTSISHREIEGLNSIPSIDFNQKHIYKNTKTIPEAIQKYVKMYQKPYVIGEVGYEWDWSKNFDDFSPEMDRDFKQALWLGLFSPTPILPLSWWWEFFEKRNMMSYYSRVQVIQNRMLAAGKGEFAEFPISVPNLMSLGVRCGKTRFILLSNTTTNQMNTNVECLLESKKHAFAQVYNCENGAFNDVQYKLLNAFKLSIQNITVPANSELVIVVNQ